VTIRGDDKQNRVFLCQSDERKLATTAKSKYLLVKREKKKVAYYLQGLTGRNIFGMIETKL